MEDFTIITKHKIKLSDCNYHYYKENTKKKKKTRVAGDENFQKLFNARWVLYRLTLNYKRNDVNGGLFK